MGDEGCPFCGSDLHGDPIPEASRENFGNHTHFSRRMAFIWDDRVQEWGCPDCGVVWSRWTGERSTRSMPATEGHAIAIESGAPQRWAAEREGQGDG